MMTHRRNTYRSGRIKLWIVKIISVHHWIVLPPGLCRLLLLIGRHSGVGGSRRHSTRCSGVIWAGRGAIHSMKHAGIDSALSHLRRWAALHHRIHSSHWSHVIRHSRHHWVTWGHSWHSRMCHPTHWSPHRHPVHRVHLWHHSRWSRPHHRPHSDRRWRHRCRMRRLLS